MLRKRAEHLTGKHSIIVLVHGYLRKEKWGRVRPLLLKGIKHCKMGKEIFFSYKVLLILPRERTAISEAGQCFKTWLLQLTIHSIQGIFCNGYRGIEENNFTSLCLNLSNRGGKIRNCLKQRLRFL